MEKLAETGSVSSILAGICILLALHLVAKVGEFLWGLREKKDAVTESGIDNLSKAVQSSTVATEKLESRIKALEHTISDVTKVKLDMRRMYAAIKLVAGDDWARIRQAIMEDEATSYHGG